MYFWNPLVLPLPLLIRIKRLEKSPVLWRQSTPSKVSKYGVFTGPYFPAFGLNTGKYGLEKTPNLNTFHAVELLDYDLQIWKYDWMNLSFDFPYFQPRLIVERCAGLGTKLLTFESIPNLFKCCLFGFPCASNILLAFSRKDIKSSTMVPLLMLLSMTLSLWIIVNI